jgi:hypothetical protein
MTRCVLPGCGPFHRVRELLSLKKRRAGVIGACRASFEAAVKLLSAAVLLALVPQNRSSRAHGVVDLSALVPHSGNLFVHRTGEMRSR